MTRLTLAQAKAAQVFGFHRLPADIVADARAVMAEANREARMNRKPCRPSVDRIIEASRPVNFAEMHKARERKLGDAMWVAIVGTLLLIAFGAWLLSPAYGSGSLQTFLSPASAMSLEDGIRLVEAR